jgi:hypothetical protein
MWVKNTKVHFSFRFQSLGLTLAILFTFSQCSLFESLTPDEPDSVEATIGQEGGSIEMSAVKIEIPEGAFSQPFTLSIEALEEQVIPAEDQASKLFQIKGLPVNFGQSIRFSIEPDDQGATGLFGVIGEKVYVPSLGNESIRYSFREGSLSNGAFSFQLEATIGEQRKQE